MFSCDFSTFVTPAVVPSPVPGAIDTIIAQTAQVAASQTASLIPPPTLTPTLVPLPTKTATVTPSPSPTFIFILSTFTLTATPPNPSTAFACKLTDQSPPDGATLPGKQDFAASWTVENTGSSAWDQNSIDFVFVSGSKLTKLKAADLPQSVGTGQTITLKLTMSAPGSADTYKTVWTLEHGKDAFCRLSLTFKVK